MGEPGINGRSCTKIWIKWIKERLEKVFDKAKATVLTEVIVDAYGELVKAGDFNELKAIVRELAEARKRTEQRIGIVEKLCRKPYSMILYG